MSVRKLCRTCCNIRTAKKYSTAIQNNNSYEKSSNEYRLFTPTVAKKLNDSGIQVWKAHPNFYRISVEENFERKLQKLNKSVLELLLQ